LAWHPLPPGIGHLEQSGQAATEIRCRSLSRSYWSGFNWQRGWQLTGKFSNGFKFGLACGARCPPEKKNGKMENVS